MGRQLGKGGVGSVFLAEVLDEELMKRNGGRMVAVKMLHYPPHKTTEEKADLFKQEVSIQWSCSFHVNVSRLVGFSLEPMAIVTKPYNTDLMAYIENSPRKFPILMTLKLLGHIVNAMVAIQELGIVHRDLKSSNILLEMNNEVILNAVVCDFGLAKVTNKARTIEGQKFQEIEGFSPRYAAPEIFVYNTLRSSPPAEVELKCDVYSFGVVIWEMLSKEVAWQGLDRMEIETKVRSGLRPAAPDVPEGVGQIIVDTMKYCWAQEPGDRPTFIQIQNKFSSIQ